MVFLKIFLNNIFKIEEKRILMQFINIRRFLLVHVIKFTTIKTALTPRVNHYNAVIFLSMRRLFTLTFTSVSPT